MKCNAIWLEEKMLFAEKIKFSPGDQVFNWFCEKFFFRIGTVDVNYSRDLQRAEELVDGKEYFDVTKGDHTLSCKYFLYGTKSKKKKKIFFTIERKAYKVLN